MIRKMRNDDIEEVVSVHIESFPDFFLSFLGRGFLTVYYKGCCLDNNSICLVTVESDGRISGFVAGSSNPQRFYHRLLVKYWYLFMMAAVIPVMRSPQILGRLLRARHYPSETPSGERNAGLYSIAVAPWGQKGGRGKMLLDCFLKEAKKRGCTRIYLTTDRDGNDRVNIFYQTFGFQIYRQYCTPEGRWMNEYVYYLRSEGK